MVLDTELVVYRQCLGYGTPTGRKFWRVYLTSSNRAFTHYGREGTDGTIRRELFEDGPSALAAIQPRVKKKLGNGYHWTKSDTHVYLNINEEGEEYGRHLTFDQALIDGYKFPNDTIVPMLPKH